MKNYNKKEDKIRAKEAVYKTKGEGPNPYEVGPRPYKFWNQSHAHYWSLESRMEELFDVYGYPEGHKNHNSNEV